MDEKINAKLSELETELEKLEPAIKHIQDAGKFSEEMTESVRKMLMTYREITDKLRIFIETVEDLRMAERLKEIEKKVKDFHEIVEVAESEIKDTVAKSVSKISEDVQGKYESITEKIKTITTLLIVQSILIILLIILKFI